jgi:arginine utilization regulatory protein
MSYSWPGNVRELEHTIEGAMNIVQGEVIDSKCLPYYLVEAYHKSRETKIEQELKPLKTVISEVEKDLIEKALKKSGGNITRASEILDVPRQTLQYKIGKYGLKDLTAGF